MHHAYPPLTPANVTFEDGVPVSQLYGDVYFSKEGGIEESMHHYIDAHALKQRFASAKDFVIGEMGFGTGLNFLLTMREWYGTNHHHNNATLHYYAIEKHPMTLKDMQHAHQAFPELAQYSAALLLQYPALIRGVHQCYITEHITLTLYFDDAAHALSQLYDNYIDAWFLDGFAPAKNEAMWHEPLMHHIGRTSKSGGTVSSFTAVSAVKQALHSAGFTMSKRNGYGRKRNMLFGTQQHITSTVQTATPTHHIAVIGGGLAGASVAYACAMQGHSVSLYERHDSCAQEASGNPAGILYPLLAKQWDAATLFYLSGFQHSINVLRSMEFDAYDICGMLDYGKNEQHAMRLKRLCSDLALDTRIASWDDTHHALYFPHSGWVDVAAWTRTMLQHQYITVQSQSHIMNIQRQNEKWQITDAAGTQYEADSLVIANAADARRLLAHYLPMRTITGQISYASSRYIHSPSPHIVCYGGYMTPDIDGTHYIGATFRKEDDGTDILSQDHEQNYALLCSTFPHIGTETIDNIIYSGRVAKRTVSADRMPIVGALYDHMFEQQLKSTRYHKDVAHILTEHIPLLPNCYVSLAHAARGLVSAPIAGHMIANSITAKAKGTIKPPSSYLSDILEPSRFLLRQWRKNNLESLSTN